jgi:hypothetical protein
LGEDGFSFGFLAGDLSEFDAPDQFLSQTRFRFRFLWRSLVPRLPRLVEAMSIIADAAVFRGGQVTAL